MTNVTTPVRILVQRRGAIGDVIMTTGVVRELRQRYGSTAVIDVMTDAIEVYRNNPHIANIIPCNAAPPALPASYDVFINLDDAYELNPHNPLADSMFYRALGPGEYNTVPELFANDADLAVVNQDLKTIGDKFIVVHMRNWHWPAKNIDMSVWFEVFEKILTQRTDFKIVCSGGPNDGFLAGHPNFFDVRTRYNVQQLSSLCTRARTFVGIDSAPYHSAVAGGCHVVSLMTLFEQYQLVPKTGNYTAITTNESCTGCWSRQPAPVRNPVCEHGDYRCTRNFDTDSIAKAILERL